MHAPPVKQAVLQSVLITHRWPGRCHLNASRMWPQTEFFFLALLPPIMFEAGFSLQVKPFFRNIGAIVALAFVGTVVSTGLVGLIMCAPYHT